jgi:hypothetical protein
MEFSDRVTLCSGGEWDRPFSSKDYLNFVTTWLESTEYLLKKSCRPFQPEADMGFVRRFITQSPFMLGAYCYRSERYGVWKRLSLRDSNRTQWYLQARLFRQIIIAWMNYRYILDSPYALTTPKLQFYVELGQRGLSEDHILDLIHVYSKQAPSEYDLERVEQHGVIYRQDFRQWAWRCPVVADYLPQLIEENKQMKRGLAPSVSVRQ